jgi:alkanesulfonate monooxygenase SsuD/methylene tetrahydromethanopterin reductase-like flavin-dependent oxidoreductase (luciferase family)
VKLGILVPQGLTGEFAGWDPAAAWHRTLAVAVQAEGLGFDSAWVYDHVGTFGTVRDEPTLEAFAVLGALATATTCIRLGPLVTRAGLRNPALLAKHVATLDVISGGRVELGLGAGATRDEALAYGFDFEPFAERAAILGETLRIVRAMLTDGHATFDGQRARVAGAINNPRGAQMPRIPIVVGGNGRATWRLAAEFADELNLDGPSPAAVAEAMPVIAAICREAGRDPATLALSVHVLPPDIEPGGDARVRLLAAYRALGVSRLMALVPGSVTRDDALPALARDAAAAGVELA